LRGHFIPAKKGQNRSALTTVVDKGLGGKSSPRANMRVDIDFSKHPLIYKQISDLADQEIRPLDLQIIYLLKRNLETAKASLGGGLDRS
jgi:hypothetical protein